MKFFDNMKYRMQQWAYGRYGYDELSRFLNILGFGLILLSFIPYCGFLLILSLALFIYVSFRSLSRNTAKRQRENNWYLNKTAPLRSRRERKRELREERKVYDLFRCKKCGNLNRVPRGKGKVRVTCPKCGEQTIRKT